jgi:fructoselysine 6-kinase
MTTVWAIGDNTIDEYVGALTRRHIGGNAVNVAMQAALLGADVHYAGAVGADDDGTAVLRALDEGGVGRERVVQDGSPTALTRIRVTETGERMFEQEIFGVTATYHPPPQVIAEATTADWVHLGMLADATRLRGELAAAGASALVTQDCAVSAGHTDLDIAFESAGEDLDRACHLAVTAIEGGAQLAVVTLGALGATAFDGATWWQRPAVPAPVVDTTGAGDSFIAGFTLWFLEHRDVPGAMVAGAQAAARTCSHYAGWPQGDGGSYFNAMALAVEPEPPTLFSGADVNRPS